jgi:SAM-dependent methyltransferase
MTPAGQLPPPPTPAGNPTAIVSALERASFHIEQVRDYQVARQINAPDVIASFPFRRRAVEPLETLVRVFNLGLTAPADALEDALGTDACETLVATGVVARRGDEVEPLIALAPPLHGLVAAYDLETHRAGNTVMGTGQSSRDVFVTRVPLRSPRVLDLGTGNGILALGAARDGADVTAVDVNARALDFARFNQWLNGVSDVEFVEGSFFDPVDHRVDQVVCNPPFVLTPDRAHLYSDSEGTGDDMVRDLVKHIAQTLRPGGFGHLAAEWIQFGGQPWAERLQQWTKGTGCDAWVVRSITRDPDVYVTMWARAERLAPEELGPRIDTWTDYLEGMGVESIGYGTITLRKRAGENWFVSEELSGIPDDYGAYLLAGFATRDFAFDEARGRRLLESLLEVAPNVVLTQEWVPSPRGWRLDHAFLRRTMGSIGQARVDETALAVMERCDGMTTVAQAITTAIHARQGDTRELPTVLEAVRALVAEGFLIPATR